MTESFALWSNLTIQGPGRPAAWAVIIALAGPLFMAGAFYLFLNSLGPTARGVEMGETVILEVVGIALHSWGVREGNEAFRSS